jgi:hypothetical protein
MSHKNLAKDAKYFASPKVRIEQVKDRKNRIYEAGVGVKRKKKKLCLCRQASMIAGDKLGDTDCLVTI